MTTSFWDELQKREQDLLELHRALLYLIVFLFIERGNSSSLEFFDLAF